MAKNNSVLNDVIRSLVADAVETSEGVCLSVAKIKRAITVSFLDSNRVSIDLLIDIESGRVVPNTVATLQENVKRQIEGATKFRAHSINVEVVGLSIAQ